MHRLLILALVMATALPAMAQTSFFTDRALQQVNVTGTPTPLTAAIPYGPVRVCSLPLTQQSPCLPLAAITDVNGNAISNAIGANFGQLTTDATGRFTFGCTLGNNYQVQVTQSASNTPAVNYPITCPGVGANPQFSSLTLNGPGATTFNAGVTSAGPNTFNGATVVKNATTLAISGPSPWIDVTSSPYGATGNGSTDDTAAIQAAVSACPATGGTVFFPGTANSYKISSKITLNTNCWYVGVGKASLITYANPSTDSYPKLFCNGGTNVVITGLNLSNAVTPTTLLLWGNSEATINGQEGFFCLGCQDLEIYNNIANNLGGAGILVVRGARERIHNNILNGNVRYGIYLLSNDSGTPTDDQIYYNTCSNNGSFGNSGFQGRGIELTLAGSIFPVIGAINTKITGNTCNGNSFYGIEVYRGTKNTDIGWNTTASNGFGGIHDYNNSWSNVHDNNVHDNGIANVPNEAGGTLALTGYGIRMGACYFCTISNNDIHDNNFGGGNIGLITVDAEASIFGSFGNVVQFNKIRNNGGTGQDIFVSQTSNNSFTAVAQFYKVTAYDCSRNVLAQSTEATLTPATTSVNMIRWAPILNACSYEIFRGTSSNGENNMYISTTNAFLDNNSAPLNSSTPPGSGTSLGALTITNLSSPAVDTSSVTVQFNNMAGSSTTATSEISANAANTKLLGNVGTGAQFSLTQQGDQNGTVTCSSGTIQKVYQNPFANVPNVVISDRTNRGGANISAIDRFSFTVSCNPPCAAVGSAANPSVAACGGNATGAVSCATNASTGTCQVNTVAVAANSVILVQQRTDTQTGTNLGVTCNTTKDTNSTAPQITAITAATSFTFQLGTITTNPECFNYWVLNPGASDVVDYWVVPNPF